MSNEVIRLDLRDTSIMIDKHDIWSTLQLTTNQVFRMSQEELGMIQNPIDPVFGDVITDHFAFRYETSIEVDEKSENRSEITGSQKISDISLSVYGFYLLLDLMDNHEESQNRGGADYEHKERFPRVYRLEQGKDRFYAHGHIIEFVNSREETK